MANEFVVKNGLLVPDIPQALIDTDKFLVSDNGVFKYRTSAEVRSDIGAGSGSVTDVGLTTSTIGITISNTPITTSGNINIEIATASASQNGLLSSSDWSTFNSKASSSGTASSGQVTYWDGTTITGSSKLLWDNTNNRFSVNATPAPWSTLFSVFSIGAKAAITNSDINSLQFVNNAYFDGSWWRYIQNGPAAKYELEGGSHYFGVATIGTAGNIVTSFPTALRIWSTGNISVNNLVDAGITFDVTGTGRFSSSLTANSFVKIGGTSTQYLMADGGVSTLTNPITGTGAAGQVAYWNGTNTQRGNNNLFWDNANGRLGIGTATPANKLDVVGSIGVNTSGQLRTISTFYGAGSDGGNIFIGGGGLSSGTGGGSSFWGSYNTSVGVVSLQNNTTGYYNTATGYGALSSNTTGISNVANGVSALQNNTIGSYNIAIGTTALLNNNSSYSVAIGPRSLEINTTGQNISIGGRSMLSNTTGTSNVGVGYQVLFANNGNNNNGFGNNAIGANTTGANNIAFGTLAGYYISGGSVANTISNNSIFLGNNTRALADNQTNQIVIGYQETGLGSNTTIIGNASTVTTALRGRLLLGTTTDNGTNALQVTGDTLLKGSGNTSATTALTVQNSDGTGIFRVYNNRLVTINTTDGGYDGSLNIGQGTNANRRALIGSLEITSGGGPSWSGVGIRVDGTNRTLFLLGPSASSINASDNARVSILGQGGAWTRISGTAINVQISDTSFSPTSGTSTYTALDLTATINQTGGANGITRGLYVQPILTAAADWRSIEWSNNTGWGLYGAGTANNYLGGDTYIGTTTTSATKFTVAGSETASSAIARGINLSTTLVAAANNDVLVGLDVNPTFTNGAFTGITNLGARITGQLKLNSYTTTTSFSGTAVGYLAFDSSGNILTTSAPISSNIYTADGTLTAARTLTHGGFNLSFVGSSFTNRFTSAGRLLLGTTTESTFILDINGTTRLQGALTVSSGMDVTGLTNFNSQVIGYSTFNFQDIIGIGSVVTQTNLNVSRAIVGALTSNGINVTSQIASTVTTAARYYNSNASTATGGTLTDLFHYRGQQGTFNGTVTNQAVFTADATVIGATNNFGFRGAIPSGANRWNLYMDGTADNYLAGKLVIGTTTVSTFALDVVGTARVSGQMSINGYTISSPSTGSLKWGSHPNTTGTYVTALGDGAITTSLYVNSVAVGASSLGIGTTGTGNRVVGVGYYAGYSNAGSFNTYIGGFCAWYQTTGQNNVFIGDIAGRDSAVGNLTIANNSIFIGQATKSLANNQTNEIVIGYATTGLGSNTTIIGNSSTTLTALRGTTIINATSINTSAVLQADSTTKGFLPPRMTTTEKNAITTPAAGLVVYDTTLNKLCVYTTLWETITSS